MDINYYTISDLAGSFNSSSYKDSEILPVSPERIKSYSANPRAQPEMPVLFTLTEKNRIIAYRTLLPDQFYNKNEKHVFAWLSGNYVHPEHRRKGYSTKLFREVEKTWDGKLMYTNYAPASKAVYDNTGTFKMFRERPGKRYYVRSALEQLLAERTGMSGLLRMTDKIINGFHDVRIQDMKFDMPRGVIVTALEKPDRKVAGLISKTDSESLFRRQADEFNWILDHPWVTEEAMKEPVGNYHFTRHADRFRNLLYYLKTDSGNGFLWVTLLNKKMSVPYFFSEDPVLNVAARQIVLNLMIENKISFITIRHPELGPVLGTRKNPFLHAKSMPQLYFCHSSLADKIPETAVIHDGDGDCVFT